MDDLLMFISFISAALFSILCKILPSRIYYNFLLRNIFKSFARYLEVVLDTSLTTAW